MRVVLREAGVDYPAESAVKIRTPQDAADAAKEVSESDTEVFAVLYLDRKSGLQSCEIVTAGLVDATLVHPREVFRTAVVKNCSSVVLVHDHPTGETNPSVEDIRITKQCVEAGRILGIDVMDHVIVARDGSFTSMRESGVVSFD